MSRLLLSLVVLLVSESAPADGPRDLLDVEGSLATRGLVTARTDVEVGSLVDASMARSLCGVLADLDRRGLSRLVSALEAAPDDTRPTGEPFAFLLLERSRVAGRTVRAIVAVGADRIGVATWPWEDDGLIALVREPRWHDIIDRDATFSGPFDSLDGVPTPEQSVELPGPYVPSPVRLDQQTMKQRLYRTIAVGDVATDRDLTEETMHVRVPAGYTPRVPAGLVVWASPSPDASIPVVFGPALDRLGLLGIGVDRTGNTRDVPDKFQLMLDAVATARTRFHVDRRRVYLVGMSGGGKVSSILAICFPEIFTGAIPIVGAGTHDRLPAEFGEHATPYFTAPGRRVAEEARTRRLAFVTGLGDFNYEEMGVRCRLLEKAGYAARLFDVPDMGHAMPTASQFDLALDWVDEPYRWLRRMEESEAQMLLAAYFEDRADPTPVTDEDRADLTAVLDAGPWTTSAWRAWDFLLQAGSLGGVPPGG